MRGERTRRSRRRGSLAVRDDGVTEVRAVTRLRVRVQHVLAQFVGQRISDSAGVDEDALVGQVRQETAALGETVGRVQGDRLPNPVDVGFPDPVHPQYPGCQVGALNFEASLASCMTVAAKSNSSS